MEYEQIIAELEQGESLNHLCKTQGLKYHSLYGKIEQAFAAWCDERNIEYTRQFQLMPKHHRYDFLINGTKLLVEIDGEYWHTREQQIIKDKIFVDEAVKMGYNVLRFTDREMTASNMTCFERIYEWIYPNSQYKN